MHDIQHELDSIDGIVSAENRTLTEQLLGTFADPFYLSNCCCHDDCYGGITIRWFEARMFCDISDDGIFISVIPFEPSTLHDVRRVVYDTKEVSLVHDKIVAIIQNKDEMSAYYHM